MFDPNANANTARANMRQQQYMRLALLLCMTMLLMDGGSNSNNSRQRSSGAKPTGALRGTGTGKSESDLSSINQRFEVLLDAGDTKSLNGLLSTQFSPEKGRGSEVKKDPHNVTGIYRGAWAHSMWSNLSVPSPGASVLGDGRLMTMQPLAEGNSLIQLRSVPIHNVPHVKYVYGILKMYAVPTNMAGGGVSNVNGNGVPRSTLRSLNISNDPNAAPGTISSTTAGSTSQSKSSSSYSSRLNILKSTLSGVKSTQDITYPIQGLHVPSTHECLLVITPSRSHRVYVGVPSQVIQSSAKEEVKVSESSATPTPPPLNPDGSSRTGPSSSSRQEALKQKRKMQWRGEERIAGGVQQQQRKRLGLQNRRRKAQQHSQFPSHDRRLFSVSSDEEGLIARMQNIDPVTDASSDTDTDTDISTNTNTEFSSKAQKVILKSITDVQKKESSDETSAASTTVDPSLSALALAGLMYLWPMPFSLYDVLEMPDFSPSSEQTDSAPQTLSLINKDSSSWTTFFTELSFSDELLQEYATSAWRNMEEMDLVGCMREMVGARGKNSTSLFTLLRGFNTKDIGGTTMPVGREHQSLVHDSKTREGSSPLSLREDLKVFENILYSDDDYGDDYGVDEDYKASTEFAAENVNDKDMGGQMSRLLQETESTENESRSVDEMNKSPDADSAVSVNTPLSSGADVRRGVYSNPLFLDPRDNNLFSMQQHLAILPSDSFMKAIQRKATEIKTSSSQNQPIKAFPFFYAERYPFATVAGLELLLVDVDHNMRSDQLQRPPTKDQDPPATKKLSSEMEKSKKKSIPPSAIPGGLGVATVSNSFQSFVATTGMSSQWLKSIRCTFSLRFMMSAGDSTSVGGNSVGDNQVNIIANDIFKTQNNVRNRSSDVSRTQHMLPQSALPQHLYEKHTGKGNNIRQLQGSMVGNVVSSACSYPLCSGRGLNISKTQQGNTINKHDEFTIIASFFKINFEALESKLSTYTFLYTLICFGQSYLLVTQMIASANPAAASRVSILSISAMAVLDAAICILHLLLSSVVSGTAFYYFLWLSFLKLVIFCILEMRFVISIYQARYAQDMAENGWAGLRNHLASLHARFYGALFLVILLVDWYYTRPLVLVFVLYSFWIPQIVYSAFTGGPAPPLTLNFSLFMTLSRLFFPLYTLACPDNFLSMLTDKFTVSFVSAEATVLWLGLQLGVVYLQHKRGVRFFVPQYFLPVRYNYSRSIAHLFTAPEEGTPVSEDAETSQKECVICYNAMDAAASGSRDYMITPCDHLFHRECLSQWLAVKMECPVCRAPLPIDE